MANIKSIEYLKLKILRGIIRLIIWPWYQVEKRNEKWRLQHPNEAKELDEWLTSSR